MESTKNNTVWNNWNKCQNLVKPFGQIQHKKNDIKPNPVRT